MDRLPDQEVRRKPVQSEPFVPEPLLDTDQAAAIMRIHPKTLQRYARQGIVRGFNWVPCGVSEPATSTDGSLSNLQVEFPLDLCPT
jgi:hypothetical protein